MLRASFIDQYIDQLREYHGISIDVGDQDGCVDTAKLHEVLDKYGIANSFEIYWERNTSKVADRFQNHVMPFFSEICVFRRSASSRRKTFTGEEMSYSGKAVLAVLAHFVDPSRWCFGAQDNSNLAYMNPTFA